MGRAAREKRERRESAHSPAQKSNNSQAHAILTAVLSLLVVGLIIAISTDQEAELAQPISPIGQANAQDQDQWQRPEVDQEVVFNEFRRIIRSHPDEFIRREVERANRSGELALWLNFIDHMDDRSWAAYFSLTPGTDGIVRPTISINPWIFVYGNKPDEEKYVSIFHEVVHWRQYLSGNRSHLGKGGPEHWNDQDARAVFEDEVEAHVLQCDFQKEKLGGYDAVWQCRDYWASGEDKTVIREMLANVYCNRPEFQRHCQVFRQQVHH
jgi:hypothetical protein